MKNFVQRFNPTMLGLLFVAYAAAGCGEPPPFHVPDTCQIEEADDDCLWSNTDREGWVSIQSAEDLEILCETPCAKAYSVRVFVREPLSTLSGLTFMTHISRLSISAREVGHIDAFSNIEEVNFLELRNNRELETIEPFQRLERLDQGGLYLHNNPTLQDLTAFSNLRTIGHPDLPEGEESDVFLRLSDNHALVDLRGLENLEYVHRIRISKNDGLESLQGLNSLEEVQSIYVNSNDNLASLEGLENLRAIHQGAFFIYNPNLRRCEIEALIDQLEITPNVVEIREVSEEPCD